MSEIIISCLTYNHNLYTTHENRIKRVILKNAKNINFSFLNKNDVQVDIDTTDDAVEYKASKIIINLNDDDVSESWSGEW